jgi:hypothetical protein
LKLIVVLSTSQTAVAFAIIGFAIVYAPYAYLFSPRLLRCLK